MFAAMLALSATSARPLHAADVRVTDSNSRYETTAAWRETLRTWDTNQHYGADRERGANTADFQPTGLRMGNFYLFPSLGFETSYESTRGLADEPDYDVFDQDVTAALRIQSDLPRHVLDFLFTGRYARSEDDNWGEQFEGSAATRFRIDIDSGHAFFGELATNKFFQDIRSSEAPLAGAEPVPVQRERINLGFKRDMGRLAALVEATYDTVDYSDIAANDGGTIDQDFRDVVETSGAINLIYRFSPGYAVLGGVSIRDIDVRGTGADDRDAQVYSAGLGLEWEINSNFSAALRARYAHRDYVSGAFDDFDSILFNGELTWRPTHLSRVRLEVGREIAETGFENSSARIDTDMQLYGDYEIMRNLTANVHLGYKEQDFLETTRTDEVLTVGAGLQYFYTKNSSFNLNYEHERRTSSIDKFGYERDVVRAGVTLAY